MTLIIPVAALILPVGAMGQEVVDTDECEPVTLSKGAARDAVDIITSSYSNWDRIGFDGKLKSSIIPMGISPTVKVFMEKGKKIQMSLRAPFVGEIGQLEMTPDSLLIVNKYYKTYSLTDIRSYRGAFPFSLDDLQSVLLGRIVLLGKGELSRKNMKYAEITLDCEGGWLIYPDDSVQPDGAQYCCLTYPDGALQALMVEATPAAPSGDDADSVADEVPDGVSMLYAYDGKKTGIEIEAVSKGVAVNGTLTLDSPSKNPSEIKNIKIPDNYMRVGLNQILKKMR